MISYPLSVEIEYRSPAQILLQLCDKPGLALLDGANVNSAQSRYSYLGVDPVELVQINARDRGKVDPLQLLKDRLSDYPQQADPHLPPFQGGLMGCFCYSLWHHLESSHLHVSRPLTFPDLAVGFYDVVIAFDHHQQKAWVVSSGYPEKDQLASSVRAESRMRSMLADLQALPERPRLETDCSAEVAVANLDQNQYQTMVERAKDYILAGDIFEVNVAQRFELAGVSVDHAIDSYLRLRELNPAPFSSYLQMPGLVIGSASPERFLSLREGQVEARPIKGTVARSPDLKEDQQRQQSLLSSEKDRAENTMIVDLMRNDLSKVCQKESVRVNKLCGLETFQTLHHLVSVISGQLQKGKDALDLLRATFPGGSITGAPKLRAMEIISELEGVCRGPYCGSMGYISFSGDMDLSILIRSFAITDDTAVWQAGGAVVLDSDPQAEYEESLLKAAKCAEVFQGAVCQS